MYGKKTLKDASYLQFIENYDQIACYSLFGTTYEKFYGNKTGRFIIFKKVQHVDE